MPTYGRGRGCRAPFWMSCSSSIVAAIGAAELVGRFGEERLQRRMLQRLRRARRVEHVLERRLHAERLADRLGGHARIVRIGEQFLDLVIQPELDERGAVLGTGPAF